MSLRRYINNNLGEKYLRYKKVNKINKLQIINQYHCIIKKKMSVIRMAIRIRRINGVLDRYNVEFVKGTWKLGEERGQSELVF